MVSFFALITIFLIGQHNRDAKKLSLALVFVNLNFLKICDPELGNLLWSTIFFLFSSTFLI